MPQLFPQCTETDLYLWGTEHLCECEEVEVTQLSSLCDQAMGLSPLSEVWQFLQKKSPFGKS
jgi:hypothetical protein